jgi:hypothetical protein
MLKIGLYAQAKKLNPDPSEEQQKDRDVKIALKTSSSRVRKNKDLIQIWGGDIEVDAVDERVIDESKWKMVLRGTLDFKHIYPILMTNENFRNREQDVPGYIDAIYIAGWKQSKRASEVEAKDPLKIRLKDAVKVGLDFKYCYYKLDTDKPTFKDALAISSYKPNECWINAIVEKYGESLMRSKKRSNVVNRETILKLVGRSEADIVDGLTVHEILPFFQRYKLRLRVYDVFFRLIFKYDPETENRRHRQCSASAMETMCIS